MAAAGGAGDEYPRSPGDTLDRRRRDEDNARRKEYIVRVASCMRCVPHCVGAVESDSRLQSLWHLTRIA